GRLEEAAVPQADEKNLGAKPTAMKPFRSAWRSGSLLSLVSLSSYDRKLCMAGQERAAYS
ncbi:MAG: hypothetical protein ACREJU_01355, partial [Nitrospiraceae bacterium]